MRHSLTLLCLVALAACSQSIGNPVPTVQSNGAVTPALYPDSSGYKVLYSFDGATGAGPLTGPIGANGQLYGTASSGGAKSNGTVFQSTPTGATKILYSFGRADGNTPVSPLMLWRGVLYGTMAHGGSKDGGTVFSVTLGGTSRVLHSFDANGNNDREPYAPLTALAGTLYGSTLNGGADAGGTIFSVSSTGTVTRFYSFRGVRVLGAPNATGAYPGGRMEVLNGALYGVTENGGAKGCGVVFSITPAGVERVIYSFKCGKDGAHPEGGLVAYKAGLYGTTLEGGIIGTDTCGTLGCGTVFSITTSGKKRTLASLDGTTSGTGLRSHLVVLKGTVYGVANGGGTDKRGTLFSVTPSGKFSVLHSFTGGSDGSAPSGVGVLGSTLYGTTYRGGARNKGTVFSFTP